MSSESNDSPSGAPDGGFAPDSDVRPRQTLPGPGSLPPDADAGASPVGSVPPAQTAAPDPTPSHPPPADASPAARPSAPPRAALPPSQPPSQPPAQPPAQPTSQPPSQPPSQPTSQPPSQPTSQPTSQPPISQPAATPAPSPESGEGMPLDSADFERVTLIDLPKIATYGRYELLGRIAFGGMAEIFLAREMGHESTARMMVVKRVLPHVAEDQHFVDMFRDEARLAMQLNHPNICHVYTFGEVEGTHYLAMEWINGQPLSKIIRKARARGGVPIPIVLKIISIVAEALDYAHRACDAKGEPLGIVHRDVSPQNIMVSYDGVVKLLDFGIAKATSHSTRTEAGIIKGKFAYMSPQQCVGELIDSRADIFALGICLFEALAGKNPFRRKTEFETMTKIVGDPTPDLKERRPETTDPIVEIVERALMKQPERRFQSGSEMQIAIETVLPTLGTHINTSRLGEYVSSLFAEDVRDGPQLDTKLKELPRAPPVSTTSTEQSLDEPPKPAPPGATDVNPPVTDEIADQVVPRSRTGCGVLAVLGVLLLLGGLGAVGAVGAWFAFGDAFDDPGESLAGLLGDLSGEPGDPSRPSTPGDPPVAPPVVPGPGPTPPLAPPVAPPDPGPTPVTTGSVYLESVPPGADIEFGDRAHAGTTPLEIGMVAPGTYDVRLRLDGHRDWTGQVTVAPGQRATLTGELERRPTRPTTAPGRLSLNTRPWSKVYLGRRLLGTTPLGRVNVPSGNLRLRLVDRDGNEHQRRIRVPPNGAVSQSFDLRE